MEKVIFKFWVETESMPGEKRTFCSLTLKVVPDFIGFGRESPWFSVVDASNSIEYCKPGFRISAKSYEIVDEQSDKNWEKEIKFQADNEESYFDLMIYGINDTIAMDIPKIINED